MTRGAARLERWVVGALSSYSSGGVGVPFESVSRWSPYLSAQTGGLGVPGPSQEHSCYTPLPQP